MDPQSFEQLQEGIKAALARGEQVRAVATTTDGEFVFDIRDRAIGWSLARGSWEPAETAFIKSLLRSGDLVVDVGANLGWYSVISARLVAPDGMVLAFEPDTTNADLFAINAARNDANQCLRLFRHALYEREAELTFELSHENFGDHRVRVAETVPGLYEEESRKTVSVRARRLDDVLAEEHLSTHDIRLLKIDSQGSEVVVFRGAREALRRTVYLVSEFWPYGLQRAGCSVEEYIAIVSEHFLEFARVTASPRFAPIDRFRDDLELPFDEAPNTPVGFSNYVFRKS